MGGRTPGQVQHFYQDNLQKTYKKGTWDPEEDEALKQASTRMLPCNGSCSRLCMMPAPGHRGSCAGRGPEATGPRYW